MPALGADMEASTLVEWLIKPGDRVKRGDVVAVVETQKGAIEVETFSEGIVSELVVSVGTKVPVGSLIARIGEPGEAVQAKAVATVIPTPPPPRPAATPVTPVVPPVAASRSRRRRAGEPPNLASIRPYSQAPVSRAR
ncbi:MAG: biotin/lipoyl-containing protein [Alphaproteobacteria bacterium]